MTALPRASVSALAAVLASLGTRPAAAVERACSAPSVEADAAFTTRHPALLERLRGEMSRPDVDTCARVQLLSTDATTTNVSVTLPDGRAATRTAHRPEDLLPVLQALLLVPEMPDALVSPAPAPRRPPPSSRPRSVRVDGVRVPHVDHQPAPTAPRSLGFELSLVGGPRLGGGQIAIGLGTLSFLEVHGFLVGFQGRADRYQTPLGGDPETALELAALAGKRLHFSDFALDFTVGPAVAMKDLGVSNVEVARVDGQATPAPPPVPEARGTGPVPRLVVASRAVFTPRDVLRTFAGVEATWGPERGDQAFESGSSTRFPRFTLGLVVGATVGTR